jgi:hypothetical protein
VCFDFLCNFFCNIFRSKKNWARYYHKHTRVFMSSTRYSCPILVKLESPRQIFEIYSNIKFHENPSSGSRDFPCWRTDGQIHDGADNGVSQFCESAYKDIIIEIRLTATIISRQGYKF